jgi:hypothetical protein
MVFTGNSPGGLSMFALISVVPQKVTAGPSTPAIPINPMTTSTTSIILIPPLLLLAAAFLMLRRE